jgi:hypothetical protein
MPLWQQIFGLTICASIQIMCNLSGLIQNNTQFQKFDCQYTMFIYIEVCKKIVKFQCCIIFTETKSHEIHKCRNDRPILSSACLIWHMFSKTWDSYIFLHLPCSFSIDLMPHMHWFIINLSIELIIALVPEECFHTSHCVAAHAHSTVLRLTSFYAEKVTPFKRIYSRLNSIGVFHTVFLDFDTILGLLWS